MAPTFPTQVLSVSAGYRFAREPLERTEPQVRNFLSR